MQILTGRVYNIRFLDYRRKLYFQNGLNLHKVRSAEGNCNHEGKCSFTDKWINIRSSQSILRDELWTNYNFFFTVRYIQYS